MMGGERDRARGGMRGMDAVDYIGTPIWCRQERSAGWDTLPSSSHRPPPHLERLLRLVRVSDEEVQVGTGCLGLRGQLRAEGLQVLVAVGQEEHGLQRAVAGRRGGERRRQGRR